MRHLSMLAEVIIQIHLAPGGEGGQWKGGRGVKVGVEQKVANVVFAKNDNETSSPSPYKYGATVPITSRIA